jgi:hypothetical protein
MASKEGGLDVPRLALVFAEMVAPGYGVRVLGDDGVAEEPGSREEEVSQEEFPDREDVGEDGVIDGWRGSVKHGVAEAFAHECCNESLDERFKGPGDIGEQYADGFFGELVVGWIGYHTLLFVGFGPLSDRVEEVEAIGEGEVAGTEGRVVDVHGVAYGFPVCTAVGVVSGLFVGLLGDTYKAHISRGVSARQSYSRTQRSTSKTNSDNVYSRSSLLILSAF